MLGIRLFITVTTLIVRSVCTEIGIWNVNNIASDLDCSSCANNPTALLTSSNQTGCAADEIYMPVAHVGKCMSCDAEHMGPGYYCRDNRAILCPTGYYCPNYTHKTICPEGTWCKSGFTRPIECRYFITCAEGSEVQRAGLGLVIVCVWLVSSCCCLSGCVGIRKARAEKAMREIAESMDDSEFVLGASFTADVPKVAISFENLSMHLKANGKCVLDNVTGHFPASSLVALMGPSGGGKTTFMNALCGRASYGNVMGKIKINGKDGGVTDFPKLVGFVPQDDIMHADLTVQQNLLYNACLRLPVSTSYEAAVLHVHQVVKTLGLDHVAHNVVGDPEKRGISGGQKKRVNIGMELAAMPAVIFMDEPTSGLDGAATVQLAKCLGNLRQSGLTIVCVIHQPRYMVFKEFSHLLLLGAGGGQVFCGAASGIEPYFQGLGFRLPSKENPADWMIDVVCGLENRFVGDADEIDDTFTAPTDLFKMWKTHCENSGELAVTQDSAFDSRLKPLTEDRITPSVLKQTSIFLTREARKFNMTSFLATCCMLFVCGLTFGVLMQSIAEFSYAAILRITTGNGFIFFMICTINARGVFGFERLQFLREFQSGTSCVAYWLAKMLWNLIAWQLYSLSYALPLYWTMPIPAQPFLSFFNGFSLAAWYHLGLGMVLTVVFPTPTISLLLCVFVPMVLELAFSGGLIAVADMNALQKALSALGCGRWFKSSLFVLEMQQYPEHALDFPAIQKVLDQYETSVSDGPVGFFWLAAMGVVLRFWALAVLLLLKYSEGSTCVGRVVHLISKWCHKVGLDAIMRPKRGDAIDSVRLHERRPARMARSMSQLYEVPQSHVQNTSQVSPMPEAPVSGGSESQEHIIVVEPPMTREDAN